MTSTTTTPTARDPRTVRLRSQIARYEAACGCELGSALAVAALTLYLGRLALHEGDTSLGSTVGHGVLWVVGASLVGKLLGLAWARLRVVQLRARLTRGPAEALLEE